MGDQQQRYFFLVEVVFQPFHHFNIQVVGGFIHDQQYMFVFKADIDQGLGQRHPFALAAGEGAGQSDGDDGYSVSRVSV